MKTKVNHLILLRDTLNINMILTYRNKQTKVIINLT